MPTTSTASAIDLALPIPPDLRHSINAAIAPMQGWCTIEKAAAMAGLILQTAPRVVVEIGVFGGRSLVPQAMALRHNSDYGQDGIIYGIDPWRREANLEGENDPANDAWWAGLDIEAIHRSAHEAIHAHGLADRALLIRAASQHACHLWPVQDPIQSETFATIDILHLDGNHSEAASTRDVRNYLPRLRPGGYLWFDDTDWRTTAAALALVAAECAPLLDVGTCRLFRKSEHPSDRRAAFGLVTS